MAIVIPAHKIAYMALPKAACSSIKQGLAVIDPDVSIPAEGQQAAQIYHGIYQTRRFRPHRWALYTDHFRFCVIRDPVERLLSVYTDRVLAKRDLFKSPRVRKGVEGLPNLPADPDPDTFFTHIDSYKAMASSIKHHALGAWHFLGRDLGPERYDRVYRLSELDALAWDLSLLSRLPVVIPRANRSSRSLALGELSVASIDAIRPFLIQEYELLSAYFDNPIGPRLYGTCAIGSSCVS